MFCKFHIEFLKIISHFSMFLWPLIKFILVLKSQRNSTVVDLAVPVPVRSDSVPKNITDTLQLSADSYICRPTVTFNSVLRLVTVINPIQSVFRVYNCRLIVISVVRQLRLLADSCESWNWIGSITSAYFCEYRPIVIDPIQIWAL